jgi:hypothetical protein
MTEGNPRLYPESPNDVIAKIGEHLHTQSDGAWQVGADTVLGGTVHLFGRLGQIIINRMNEIPEQHFRAFLNEAEIDTLPPRPARAEITFLPAADGPAEIRAPAGTQVATRPAGDLPALIYETEHAITVTPVGLVKCVAVDPIRYSDHTAAAQGAIAERYSAFVGEFERDRILYIGEIPRDDPAGDLMLAFPAAVDRQYVTLSLFFDLQPRAEDDTPAVLVSPPTAAPWRIRWLYWDGKAWADLATSGAHIDPETFEFDQCGASTTARRVDFTNLPDLPPTEANGIAARWLAAQLTGGDTRNCLPTLRDIRIERTIRVSGAQPAQIDAGVCCNSGWQSLRTAGLEQPVPTARPAAGFA